MTLNTLTQTATYFGVILAELVALFLVVSVAVGLLQQYVLVTDKVRAHLRRPGLAGNAMGAALGALTPFCSCSTVPILAGLIQSGTRFGISVSFLLASPLLNPLVLGLMAYAFGLKAALTYGAVTFVMVVLAGAIWEKAGLAAQLKPYEAELPAGFSRPKSFRTALKWSALGALWQLRTVLPYLLVGVAAGAAVYGLVPEEFIVKIAGPDTPLAIPVAGVIGIPLYVRTETMIPIALALATKGMGLGAIVALIIGGSGASLPELSLLARLFRPPLLAAFVLTGLAMAVATGFAFEMVLA